MKHFCKKHQSKTITCINKDFAVTLGKDQVRALISMLLKARLAISMTCILG